MSFQLCDCGTLGNTGISSKNGKFGDVVAMIFVQLNADDGTKNTITNADDITSAYYSAKLNDPDPSKRWYQVGNKANPIVRWNSTREDVSFEDFSDGSRAILNDQTNRPMLGTFKQLDNFYASKIKRFNCVRYGVYHIDGCGNLRGEYNAASDTMDPIIVEDNTTWTRPRDTSKENGNTQVLDFGMDFGKLVKDDQLALIPSAEITADILGSNGLFDVSATDPTNKTTTTFTTSLFLDYKHGFIKDREPAVAWVIGDFLLENNTTGLPVVITSVTETSTPGEYDFVIPAQTLTNSLTLSASKTGFVLDPKTFEL